MDGALSQSALKSKFSVPSKYAPEVLHWKQQMSPVYDRHIVEKMANMNHDEKLQVVMDHVRSTVRKHELHFVRKERRFVPGKIRPLEIPQEYVDGSGIISSGNVSPSRGDLSTFGGHSVLGHGALAGSETRATLHKLHNGQPLVLHLQTPDNGARHLEKISEMASSQGAATMM